MRTNCWLQAIRYRPSLPSLEMSLLELTKSHSSTYALFRTHRHFEKLGTPHRPFPPRLLSLLLCESLGFFSTEIEPMLPVYYIQHTLLTTQLAIIFLSSLMCPVSVPISRLSFLSLTYTHTHTFILCSVTCISGSGHDVLQRVQSDGRESPRCC